MHVQHARSDEAEQGPPAHSQRMMVDEVAERLGSASISCTLPALAGLPLVLLRRPSLTPLIPPYVQPFFPLGSWLAAAPRLA